MKPFESIMKLHINSEKRRGGLNTFSSSNELVNALNQMEGYLSKMEQTLLDNLD